MPTDETQLILSDGSFPVEPGAEVTFTAQSFSKGPFQPFRLEIGALAPQPPSPGPLPVRRFEIVGPAVGWVVLRLRIQRWDQMASPEPVPAEMFGPGVPSLDLAIIRPGEHVDLVMRNSSKERATVGARLVGRDL